MPGEDIRSGILATSADTDASSSSNPATIGSDHMLAIRLWMLNPYGLSELRIQGISISGVARSVGIGASAQSVSYDDIRLIHAGGNLSVALTHESRTVRLGLNSRLQYASAYGAYAHTTFGARLGLLIQMSSAVYVGSILGSWFATTSSSAYEGSFNARLGMSFVASDQARFFADMVREKYYPTSVRVGLEWSPVHALHITAGFSSYPERLALGLILIVQRIRVLVTADHHDQLGLSRHAGLEIRL